MEDEGALSHLVAAFEQEFEGVDVLRPDGWGGFLLTPLEIEFWVNRPYRLHDRLLFTRTDLESPWTTQRLYP